MYPDPRVVRFVTEHFIPIRIHVRDHAAEWQRLGERYGVQWTPTYIKTDAEGWWCDPYWGCYLTGDPQYQNQFQFHGGVTARF